MLGLCDGSASFDFNVYLVSGSGRHWRLNFHMPSTFFLFILLVLSLADAARAQSVVPLWHGAAPQSLGNAPKDTPTLTVFLPENHDSRPTPAIVICPGGGYAMLSLTAEGSNEAKWFQSRGVAGLVLTYRLPTDGYRHPVPLLDAQRALRLVRNNAAQWKIDPAKIGIMGFSAGGHLASTLETHFDAGNLASEDSVDWASCRPDFAVLVYPVISMKDGITHSGSKSNLLGPNPDPSLVANLSNETQVTRQTPATDLVVALDDGAVPPLNSQLMYAALQKAGVPSALQAYPKGGHGFGFGNVPDSSPPGWLDRVADWMKSQGFMP
jgi:acetyl esterase/lipase